MMSIWEKPVDKLPWYHQLWARQLNWIINKLANGLKILADCIRK